MENPGGYGVTLPAALVSGIALLVFAAIVRYAWKGALADIMAALTTRVTILEQKVRNQRYDMNAMDRRLQVTEEQQQRALGGKTRLFVKEEEHDEDAQE